jgi:hypothetical protein
MHVCIISYHKPFIYCSEHWRYKHRSRKPQGSEPARGILQVESNIEILIAIIHTFIQLTDTGKARETSSTAGKDFTSLPLLLLPQPNHLQRLPPKLILSLLIKRPGRVPLISRTHRISPLERPLRLAIRQVKQPFTLPLLPQRSIYARRRALRMTLQIQTHSRILLPPLNLLLRKISLQARDNPSRVQRQTVQVLRAEAAGDAVGEVDVGGFGLAVGCPGLVGVRFREVEIVRAGWSYAVAEGGDGNDAGAGSGCGRGEEEGFEEVEEEEVGEVVGGELGFETVDGFAVGGGHNALGG